MARKKAPSSQTELDTFPLRLKELMTEAPKTSQQALADKIGVTRQAVSNYMTGQSSPDWKTLKAIADYFKVSSDYLIGISNIKSVEPNKAAAIALTGLSEAALDEILLLKTIPFENEPLDKMLSASTFGPLISSMSMVLSLSGELQEAIESVQSEQGPDYIMAEAFRDLFYWQQRSIKNFEYMLSQITGYGDIEKQYDNAVIMLAEAGKPIQTQRASAIHVDENSM